MLSASPFLVTQPPYPRFVDCSTVQLSADLQEGPSFVVFGAWKGQIFFFVGPEKGHCHPDTFDRKDLNILVLQEVLAQFWNHSTLIHVKKAGLTFHYTGSLRGILIMAYYDPHVTG